MGTDSASLLDEQHELRNQFSSAYKRFLNATWQSAQCLNSINETVVPSAQNSLRESGWWSRCSDVKPREPKLGVTDPKQAVEAARQLSLETLTALENELVKSRTNAGVQYHRPTSSFGWALVIGFVVFLVVSIAGGSDVMAGALVLGVFAGVAVTILSKAPAPKGKENYAAILGIQAAVSGWHQQVVQAERAQFDAEKAELAKHLSSFCSAVSSYSPEWTSDSWADWQPATELPSITRIGFQKGGMLLSDIAIPAIVPSLRSRPILTKADPTAKAAAAQGVQSIATRLLASMPPAKLKLTFIDPVGLGRSVAQFMALSDYDDDLVTGKAWAEPSHIEQRLADLTQHIENVNQKYLRDDFPTLEDYNRQAGRMAEAYRLLLIFDFPTNFSDTAARRLSSILKNGTRCGIFTIIVADTEVKLPYGVNLSEMEQDCDLVSWVSEKQSFVWEDAGTDDWTFAWDAAAPDVVVKKVVGAVGSSAEEGKRVEIPFTEIAPASAEYWKESTKDGISIPLGPSGARKIQHLDLGKGTSQHLLVAGKTGSGKSTLWHIVVAGAALRYPADELDLYLIDFKKGVEFKCYASEALPHARVIAIESEREFGLSVLQGLDQELKRRGELFRAHGVDHISAYRDTTSETMPRVLLIVDEFHEFFTEDDQLASLASQILDRLVRQGRAFGVHVLLGSQTIAGAYNLAKSTVDQMAVRIALQCSEADSRLILADDNPAARLLSRPGEAVYNASNGLVEGNSRFQIAWFDDGERNLLLKEVRQLGQSAGRVARTPIVFEGNAPALIDGNHELSQLLVEPTWGALRQTYRAWVGEPIAIANHVEIRLRRQSGGNLLVLGQREDLGLAMLGNIVVSLAAQIAPGAGEVNVFDFSLVDSADAVFLSSVVSGLPQGLTVSPRRDLEEAVRRISREIDRRLAEPDAVQPPVFLVVSGIQRARDLRPDDAGTFGGVGVSDAESPLSAHFLKIIREGPELGIHTLVWCDTLANLNRSLERRGIREFGTRVAFQMSAEDSAGVIDTPAASRLGMFRALLLDENEGRLEKFRPYGLPGSTWLNDAKSTLLRSAHLRSSINGSSDGHRGDTTTLVSN